MKTPEEILRKSGHIFDAIEEAQKEAWNEAIQLSIENAQFEMQTIYTYHGNGIEPTI